MVVFEVSFSITKEDKKKKDNGEIAFALISSFYVQGQSPVARSATKRAFVSFAEFIIAKYLK